MGASARHGLHVMADLFYFSKDRWRRFAQIRLAHELPSALEFIVSDTIETFLDELQSSNSQIQSKL